MFFNSKNTDIDKIAIKAGTDKSSCKHFYTKQYNFYFSPIRNIKLNIIEIGVCRGESIFMWGEFFKNSNIYGIELKEFRDVISPDILEKYKIFFGDQADKNFLRDVCDSIPEKFDIIIDDGSHKSDDQISSFQCLFPELKNGGVYVIEDIYFSYNKIYNRKDNSTILDFINKRIDDLNFHGRFKWCNFDIIKKYERSQEKVRDKRKKEKIFTSIFK
jgi:hypothetical protein